MCFYYSKPGHNKRNYYYKYPNKGGVAFWERNKDKIAKLWHTVGYKNVRDKPNIAELQNVRGFIV